jgi:CheY-like chemotaxis protein/Tfp pilus assembly protein PilZ
LPREPRVVSACQVEFLHLEERVTAVSEDLGRHGVFVRTERFLPVGDVVDLTIRLPDGTQLQIISRVAHLLAETAARALGRRPGMGFEFLENDPQRRATIDRCLDQLLKETAVQPHASPRGRHVVVADGSAPLLSRLATALGDAGFLVRFAANGAEAYKACVEEPPDLLLADVSMPVMTGWRLVETLASRPRLSEIPVVLMSEDASDMTRLKAYRLGVRDFVNKPFTDEELVLRLRRLFATVRPPPDVVLRGDLAQIGVGTLLSLLDFERKSGILIGLRDDRVIRVFLASGRVVKVEGPGATSTQSLMDLLDWKRGTFEFIATEVVGEDEVGLPTSNLLLEHARMCDERDRAGDAPSVVLTPAPTGSDDTL